MMLVNVNLSVGITELQGCNYKVADIICLVNLVNKVGNIDFLLLWRFCEKLYLKEFELHIGRP